MKNVLIVVIALLAACLQSMATDGAEEEISYNSGPIYGLAFGLPGIGNIVLGYKGEDLGLKMYLSPIKDSKSITISVPYYLIDGRLGYISINPSYSLYEWGIYTRNQFSLSAEFHFWIFFVEFGPALLFQNGYPSHNNDFARRGYRDHFFIMGGYQYVFD